MINLIMQKTISEIKAYNTAKKKENVYNKHNETTEQRFMPGRFFLVLILKRLLL